MFMVGPTFFAFKSLIVLGIGPSLVAGLGGKLNVQSLLFFLSRVYPENWEDKHV